MKRDYEYRRIKKDRMTWLSAVVLAGVWLSFWCLLLNPQSQSLTSVAQAKPRMVYFASDINALSNDAMHDVWSPILFSLPTSIGFSQGSLSKSNMMLPPIELPTERPLFLNDTEKFYFQSPVEVWGNVKQDTLSQLNIMRIDADATQSVFSPDSSPDIRLEFNGGISSSDFRDIVIPSDNNMLDGVWEVRVRVAINTNATIAYAMLDKRSEDASRDQYIISLIRQWGPVKHKNTVQGTLTISRSYPSESLSATGEAK